MIKLNVRRLACLLLGMGPAVRDGYTYTREFAHVSVQLDIENETASIVWK